MTRAEFEKWIEERGSSGRTHYEDLLRVALARTRRDKRRRGYDYGQEAAKEAVQAAMAQALGSDTLAVLSPAKTWPWLVDQVRGHVGHARRAARRAGMAHRAWAGSFLDEQGRHGKRTQVPFREDDQMVQDRPELIGKRGSGRMVAVDRDQNDDENGHDFVGPRGDWKGEYAVAHIGPCPCGSRGSFESVGSERLRRLGFRSERYRYAGTAFSRIEVGRDRERMSYSKRWTVEALMAIEHAVGGKAKPATVHYHPPWRRCVFCAGPVEYRERTHKKGASWVQCSQCGVAYSYGLRVPSWYSRWTETTAASGVSLGRLAGFTLGCVAKDAASRTIHRQFQVIGCRNGHRTYTGEMA